MAAQARVPPVLRYAGGLRASHSVERNTLARPLELEPAAENKKGWTRCHPHFAYREGIRDEMPLSRVGSAANAKKARWSYPPCPFPDPPIPYSCGAAGPMTAPRTTGLFSCSISASFCRLRRNSISSSPEWKRRDFPESTSSIRPSSSSWLCSPWLPRHTTKAPCMTKFSLRQV
jgi:hypothetical protein